MITPSFALTATERVLPRLALDFTTASLDTRVTFTRTGNTATVVNSSGYITPINANLPRFDFNPVTLVCRGLLIEEARTNIFTYSNTFANVIWITGNVNFSTTATLSPDGTSSVQTWTANGSAATHFFSQAYVASASATTCSIYAKAGTNNFFQIRLGADATVFANFDVATGVIGTTGNCTATITPSINGFYRCTITYTSATATAVAFCIVTSNTAVRNESNSLSTSVLFYGAQLEVGAFATSYIDCPTTATTRNADVASMTGTNFTDWYNATEGTIAGSGTSFGIIAGATFGRLLAISNAAATDTIEFRNWSGSTNNSFIVQISSLQQAQLSFGAAVNNTSYNYIGAYKVNNFAASINAATVLTDAAGNIPTVDRMIIGNLSAQYYNGHIRKISYYPQRLTNAELQAFSK